MPTPASKVLLFDDDKEMRTSLVTLLESAGFDVVAKASALGAEALIQTHMPDVILSDVRMPGRSGLDLLTPDTTDAKPPLVFISAHADIQMAVDAIQRGAYGFLEKPFDPRRLITVLEHASEKHRLRQSTARLKARLADLSGLNRIFLGQTPEISAIRNRVLDYATLPSPVLITGETGTGKEVIARALHDLSPRGGSAFQAINCATLPEAQFEAVMFGIAGERAGLLEAAHGGTVFLDEVTSAPASVQQKLLRVLETGRFMALGATTETESDFRLVSATNEKSDAAMQAGSLREDFYFRINTLELNIPALRDRADDIPILFNHFLANFARIYEISTPELTSEDLAALLAHPWPGNVRELRTMAERTALSARIGTAQVADLLSSAGIEADVPENLRGAVAAFERALIARAIKAYDGRMDEIAAHLGIGRRTLNEKIVKLGLEKDKIL